VNRCYIADELVIHLSVNQCTDSFKARLRTYADRLYYRSLEIRLSHNGQPIDPDCLEVIKTFMEDMMLHLTKLTIIFYGPGNCKTLEGAAGLETIQTWFSTFFAKTTVLREFCCAVNGWDWSLHDTVEDRCPSLKVLQVGPSTTMVNYGACCCMMVNFNSIPAAFINLETFRFFVPESDSVQEHRSFSPANANFLHFLPSISFPASIRVLETNVPNLLPLFNDVEKLVIRNVFSVNIFHDLRRKIYRIASMPNLQSLHLLGWGDLGIGEANANYYITAYFHAFLIELFSSIPPFLTCLEVGFAPQSCHSALLGYMTRAPLHILQISFLGLFKMTVHSGGHIYITNSS
jgi:hypothetical protein